MDHSTPHETMKINNYSNKLLPTAVMSAVENLIGTIKPVLSEKWEFNDRENPISKAFFYSGTTRKRMKQSFKLVCEMNTLLEAKSCRLGT